MFQVTKTNLSKQPYVETDPNPSQQSSQSAPMAFQETAWEKPTKPHRSSVDDLLVNYLPNRSSSNQNRQQVYSSKFLGFSGPEDSIIRLLHLDKQAIQKAFSFYRKISPFLFVYLPDNSETKKSLLFCQKKEDEVCCRELFYFQSQWHFICSQGSLQPVSQEILEDITFAQFDNSLKKPIQLDDVLKKPIPLHDSFFDSNISLEKKETFLRRFLAFDKEQSKSASLPDTYHFHWPKEIYEKVLKEVEDGKFSFVNNPGKFLKRYLGVDLKYHYAVCDGPKQQEIFFDSYAERWYYLDRVFEEVDPKIITDYMCEFSKQIPSLQFSTYLRVYNQNYYIRSGKSEEQVEFTSGQKVFVWFKEPATDPKDSKAPNDKITMVFWKNMEKFQVEYNPEFKGWQSGDSLLLREDVEGSQLFYTDEESAKQFLLYDQPPLQRRSPSGEYSSSIDKYFVPGSFLVVKEVYSIRRQDVRMQPLPNQMNYRNCIGDLKWERGAEGLQYNFPDGQSFERKTLKPYPLVFFANFDANIWYDAHGIMWHRLESVTPCFVSLKGEIVLYSKESQGFFLAEVHTSDALKIVGRIELKQIEILLDFRLPLGKEDEKPEVLKDLLEMEYEGADDSEVQPAGSAPPSYNPADIAWIKCAGDIGQGTFYLEKGDIEAGADCKILVKIRDQYFFYENSKDLKFVEFKNDIWSDVRDRPPKELNFKDCLFLEVIDD